MKRITAILSLWLFLLGCGDEAPEARAGDRPELIVIFSVDTLRADRVGAYGYERGSTPKIDAFARDGILFESAFSQVPLTLPSHVSMLTGQAPAKNGVRDNLGFRIDPKTISIASTLSGAGYRTAGFVSSWVLRGETGLGQMFGTWDDEIGAVGADAVGELSRPGSETVDRAIGWLRQSSGPRFLFVHIFEPHTPYDPPAGFSNASDPYDGEVSASDALFGRLTDELRSSNLYDDSLIVFMSDHGEGLGDHGEEEHGIFLYREAIHVPLVVKLPMGDRAGSRVTEPVALLDIFPTIVEIAHLGSVPGLEGSSLVAEQTVESDARTIVSETMYPRIHLGWSDLVSVVKSNHHLIDAPSVELYDMSTDPDEKSNLASDRRRVVAELREVAASVDRTIESMTAIDPAEADKLASLGYLSGGSSQTGPLPDPKDRIGDLESFTSAHDLLANGRPAQAAERTRELLERNPQFADAWILQARAYERMSRFEDAYRSYRKAIEVAPNLAAGTSLSIARVLTSMGRYAEAAEHAAVAAAQHPEAVKIARARAKLFSGDPGGAERELAGIRSNDSLFSEAKLVQSQIEIARRQPERALAAIEEAQHAVNQPVETLEMLRADALVRLGRIAEAKAAFEREISLFPHNREAYLRLMAIQVLEGNLPQAEATATRLEKTNPGSAAEIADAYRKLGQQSLASRWASR